MIAELVIGVGCIALGFYAVYKLHDNCILIIYRRERSAGDAVTRGGSGRGQFSFGRTFRDLMQALKEHGSLNINYGSSSRRGNSSSHNLSMTRGQGVSNSRPEPISQ